MIARLTVHLNPPPDAALINLRRPPPHLQEDPPTEFPWIDRNQTMRFDGECPLKLYLALKRPASNIGRHNTTTIEQVSRLLRDIIIKEQLYRKDNPAIIIPDEAMADALHFTACIWWEIYHYVGKQLVAVKTPSHTSLHGRMLRVLRLRNTNRGLGLPTSTRRQPLYSRILDIKFTPPTLAPGTGPITNQTRVRATGGLANLIQWGTMDTYPGQEVFRYEQVKEGLFNYIAIRRGSVLDPNNSKILRTHDASDLGAALGGFPVFHMTQTALIINQRLTFLP